MTNKHLTDDQLIDNIILLAIRYRERFEKNLGITSEIGEYKASRLLNLTRADGNINKGFDAVDKAGKKVQIKSRIFIRKQERTGQFSNFDFDYAVLVLMSSEYEVLEIWKASRRKIKGEIERQAYKRPSLSINKFKSIALKIYPQSE